MNKNIFLLFVISILFIGFASAQVNMTLCQDQMFINEIPCYDITPYLNCTDYVYNITNLTDGNNSLIIENGTLYPIGDGTYTYNFTFGVGSYGVVLCDGTSGKFNVLPQTEYLFLIVVICAMVLLIIWFLTRDAVFQLFSGILIIVTGFYSYYYPLVVTNSFIDNLIPFSFWGLGAFLLLRGSLEMFGGER